MKRKTKNEKKKKDKENLKKGSMKPNINKEYMLRWYM